MYYFNEQLLLAKADKPKLILRFYSKIIIITELKNESLYKKGAYFKAFKG